MNLETQFESQDDFEFRPLTEGLGFHQRATEKKADKKSDQKLDLKMESDVKKSSLAPSVSAGAVSAAPMKAAAGLLATPASVSSLRKSLLDLDTEPSFDEREESSSSKTISDLIASLPPSLDFIEDSSEGRVAEKASAGRLSAKIEAAKAESLGITKEPKVEIEMPKPAEATRPQIFQPFAREDFKVGGAGATIGTALGNINLPAPGSKASVSNVLATTPTAPPALPSSPYRERLDESFARAFPHADRKTGDKANDKSVDKAFGKRARKNLETHKQTEKKTELATQTAFGGLQPVPANLGSGFLDAMVVTGMSTLLLVAIIAITRVNLWGLLTNAQTDVSTQFHIVLLCASVLQMYLLTARSFFGASLGEWAFDLQLGTDEDQKAAVYPLKVAARTVLITLTGFVVLPLLSTILRRDVVAKITGLQLFQKP